MTPMTIDEAMLVAFGFHQSGRLAEAEVLYRQVLAQSPDHTDALHRLGVLEGQSGHTDASIDLIGRAIAINPDVAEYHHNLGETYRRARQWERAIPGFRRAIEINPEYAEAYVNLGLAFQEAGRFAEALSTFGLAMRLWPDLAEVENSLGNALRVMGRPDEALAAYARAIEKKPDYPEAHNNVGVALFEMGRPAEALVAYGRALALRPDYAEAHNNLGAALFETEHPTEALVAYGRALALRPEYAEAHNNLGGALLVVGRTDEALACFRRAVGLKTDFRAAESNLLFALHFHPDYDAQAILEEHRRWARRQAEPLAPAIRTKHNDRSPDRRLRIGFVSPDFRDHPVGRLLLPLFAYRDRRQSEFFCYSDVRAADASTNGKWFGPWPIAWHDTAPLGDADLAERIHSAGIDILVDLALHTSDNRMGVFARKPAPVQVTMLGLPATTGLTTIDYRLTDPYLDPPGASDADYSEQSIRLPHCFWTYRPPDEAPAVGALPALKNGFVTFGCLNQFAKVSGPAMHLWVKILQCVPGSRLVLQSQPGPHQDRVREVFWAGGIAAARVEFAGNVPLLPYLQRYHELDLCLDPFPYNGHTGTLDALWMGVPVITLAGRTGVGRGGVSILSNVGLPELIAATPENYVTIAVELAGDRVRLTQLRAGLRPRMLASPLLDGKGYTADVEAAFRRMWTTWCGQ